MPELLQIWFVLFGFINYLCQIHFQLLFYHFLSRPFFMGLFGLNKYCVYLRVYEDNAQQTEYKPTHRQGYAIAREINQ
jgi:hypothetical protein